jgi:Carboxypeptidase regulatory-like domain
MSPSQNAAISGLIGDPTGLPVPNVCVVARSEDRRAIRKVVSNQQGEPARAAPGAYALTVEVNGFKTVHQNGMVLEVGQRARLDFSLIIGGNTEPSRFREVRRVNGQRPDANYFMVDGVSARNACTSSARTVCCGWFSMLRQTW